MGRHKLTFQGWTTVDLGQVRPPAAKALERQLVTQVDLLRLKAIARLHARGLPPEFDWSDLLQEAFARMLDGSRKKPDGLPMVAFLAGVMRSLRAQYWQRARVEGGQPSQAAGRAIVEAVDPNPDVERELIAAEQLVALERLFADDSTALAVMSGLGAGLAPDEIRARNKLSKTDYDSTRRRMRRALFRAGISMGQP